MSDNFNFTRLSASLFYQCFYSSLKSRIAWALASLVSLILFLLILLFPPVPEHRLALRAITLTLWVVFLFLFLRANSYPVLQIFSTEIIITRLMKHVVPVEKIKLMKFHGSKVEILYFERFEKQLQISVLNNSKNEIEIKNGEIYIRGIYG